MELPLNLSLKKSQSAQLQSSHNFIPQKLQETQHQERECYSYKTVKYYCRQCNKYMSRMINSNEVIQNISCGICSSICQPVNPNLPRTNVNTQQQNSQQPQKNQQQQQQQQQQNPQYQHQMPQHQPPPIFVQTTYMMPGVHFTNIQNLQQQQQSQQQQQFEEEKQQQPLSPHFTMNQLMILDDILPLPLIYNPFFHFPFMRNGREIQIERLIQEFLNNDPNNYGPQPATQENISKLKSKKVELNISEPCSICQDNLKQGETINELPCKHFFHKECINEWLSRHNSCPICRKSI